jgi:hypothetical protein
LSKSEEKESQKTRKPESQILPEIDTDISYQLLAFSHPYGTQGSCGYPFPSSKLLG